MRVTINLCITNKNILLMEKKTMYEKPIAEVIDISLDAPVCFSVSSGGAGEEWGAGGSGGWG